METTFDDIKAILAKIELPAGPFKLSEGETIIDVQKFVNSHISFVENIKKAKLRYPYFLRLYKFTHLITK